MSNCSEPLQRLLGAMAEEWSGIAHELDALGAALSGSTGGGQALQRFDLLQQRAQGQANLLAQLGRKLTDDNRFDRKRIEDLLANIPFHAVRASFEAAFEGRAAPQFVLPEEVDWL